MNDRAIFEKTLIRAMENSTKNKNVYPIPQPSFLTNTLNKGIGEFISLSVQETEGKFFVYFKLSNYKNPVKRELEFLFKHGVFWTAFLDKEDYLDVFKEHKEFLKLETYPEKANFFKKYL